MGGAYLCAEAGISNAVIANQAAYIAGWLKRLRDDRRLVILAAAQAQHAADYILGRREAKRRCVPALPAPVPRAVPALPAALR